MQRMCEERLKDPDYADIHIQLIKDKSKVEESIANHKQIIQHYHAHSHGFTGEGNTQE